MEWFETPGDKYQDATRYESPGGRPEPETPW